VTIEIAQGFHVELDEEDVGYQLCGPGEEESGITPYGDMAEVEVDGKMYGMTVFSKEEALTDLPPLYLRLDGIETPSVEEVEFEEDETEEEEDEDETDAA